MDPRAALDRILEAAAADDVDEFNAACRDLADWLARGGFRIQPRDLPRRLVTMDRPRSVCFAAPAPRTSPWVLFCPFVSPVAAINEPYWTLKRYSEDGRLLESHAVSEAA